MKNKHKNSGERFRKSGVFNDTLLANPKFEKEIKKLRQKWSISANGFIDDKQSELWHKKIEEDSDKAIELIDKREKGITVPLNDFWNDINTVINKFNLPSRYVSFVEYYLKFSKVSKSESATVVVNYNRKLNRKEMFIQIYTDTTLEDIKSVWSRVRRFKKYLVGYRKDMKVREITNLQVEKRAYELQQEGVKPKKISEILKKEGLGTYDYDYVVKLISRFRKRTSNN
jgi:hypothetical protein